MKKTILLAVIATFLFGAGCLKGSNAKQKEKSILNTPQMKWLVDQTWTLNNEDGLVRQVRISSKQKVIWMDEWVSLPRVNTPQEEVAVLQTKDEFSKAEGDQMILCRMRSKGNQLKVFDEKRNNAEFRIESNVESFTLVPTAGNSDQCAEVLAHQSGDLDTGTMKMKFIFAKRWDAGEKQIKFAYLKGDETHRYQRWAEVTPNEKCINFNGSFASLEDVENDITRHYRLDQCDDTKRSYSEWMTQGGAPTAVKEFVADLVYRTVSQDKDKDTVVKESRKIEPKSLRISRFTDTGKTEEELFIVYTLDEWGDLLVTEVPKDLSQPKRMKTYYRQSF